MATVKLADQPVKPERSRLKLVAEALDETIKKKPLQPGEIQLDLGRQLDGANHKRRRPVENKNKTKQTRAAHLRGGPGNQRPGALLFLVLGRSFSCSDVDVAVGETTEEKEDTPPCLATTMEPAFNGAATRRGQMLLDHLRFYVTRFCSASLSLSLSLAQRPPPLCQRLDLHVSCVANTFLHPAQCVRLGVFFCFFFFGGCFPGPAFESSRHRPTFTAVFYYFAVGVEDRDRQTERERERETKVKELDLTGGGYQPARRLLRPRRKTQRNENPKKTQKNSTL